MQDPTVTKDQAPARPKTPQSEEKSVVSGTDMPAGGGQRGGKPPSPPRQSGYRQLPGFKGNPEKVQKKIENEPDSDSELEVRRMRLQDPVDAKSDNSMVPLLILGALFFIMVK